MGPYFGGVTNPIHDQTPPAAALGTGHLTQAWPKVFTKVK